MKRFYGWKKEPKDKRDYRLSYYREFELPPEVDLRQYCSPVQDQRNLGACTGFAIADGMREFLLNKLEREHTELSPLFLYYYERELTGTIHEDSGAYIRDGFKVLAKIGVAPEAEWPYDISKFTCKPSEQAFLEADRYKIVAYRKLATLFDIRATIANGSGCAFGFMVRSSFECQQNKERGIMPMPKKYERYLGGHAVFCCGYKDDAAWEGGGYLIIKNSWGVDWGDKGYFYMPYAYVQENNVQDIWTAEL